MTHIKQGIITIYGNRQVNDTIVGIKKMTLEANDNKDAMIDYEVRVGIQLNRLEDDFFLDDISRAALKRAMTGEEDQEEIVRVISFLAGYANALRYEKNLKYYGVLEK